jgi:outer membrane autotransporter protein
MQATHAYRRFCAAGLGLAAAVSFINAGHTQALPSFSALTGSNPLAAVATNASQSAMAQSINNVCPTISQSNIFSSPGEVDLAHVCTGMLTNSFGLSTGQLAGALSQLNGGTELVVPTSQASTLQNIQYNVQTGVIEGRLSLLRDRLSTGALASTDSPQQGQLAVAASSDSVNYAQLAQNSVPSSAAAWNGPLGIYVTGIGQFGDRDTTGNQNGYSFDNAGFIAGADYAITRQLVAGMAFSYTHADTDFDASATSAPGQFLHEDLFQGNLYATYAVTDALYFDGVATIGGGDNYSQRQIVIPSTNPAMAAVNRTATGSFGSSTYAVSLGGGYNLPVGALVVTPTARFQYDYSRSDSFVENGGSGVDLSYGTSNHDDVLSFIGARAQYTMNTAWGPLTPTVRFEWAHQFNSGASSVSVAYSNDPLLLSNFSSPSDPASRNYVDLGAGLTLQLTPSQSMYVTYDGIVGLNHTSYNSLTGGIRFTF